MKRVPTKLLEVGKRLDHAIFQENGRRLMNPGELLLSEHVALMQNCGIPSVIVLESGDHAADFEHVEAFTWVPIDKVRIGDVLAASVEGRNMETLLGRGEHVDLKRLKLLKQRGVDRLLVERPLVGRKAARDFLDGKATIHERSRSRERFQKTVMLIKDRLAPKEVQPQLVHAAAEQGDLRDQQSGAPLDLQVRDHARTVKRSQTVMDQYVDVYTRGMAVIDELARQVRERRSLDSDSVGVMVHDLLEAMVEDRSLYLSLSSLTSRGDMFATHTMNSTLLAINLASMLGYSQEQVLEAGMGAFFHDLGMLTLPQALIAKPSALSDAEKAQMRAHPHEGVLLLKHAPWLPRGALFAVYQHHERCDGGGYPKKYRHDQIHRFAHIVAVADCYAAMTAKRPYRDAFTPATAAQVLLQGAVDERLDAATVQAFLKMMSLYPVGSWVELSNATIARVIAANEEHLERPVVRTVLDAQLRYPVEQETIDLAATPQVAILRAIPASDLNVVDLAGFGGVQVIRESTPAPAKPTEKAEKKALTVLIVEDEPAIREILRQCCAELGITDVHECFGRTALEITDKLIPDLVFLDLGLGAGVSGVEVLKKLRHNPACENTAVFVVSGMVTRDVSENILGQGIEGIIVKPFKVADIERVLHHVLDGTVKRFAKMRG